MNDFDKNNNFEETDFFKKIDVPFAKSKDQVWADISKKIEPIAVNEKNTKIISMPFYKMAAAVAILITCSTLCLKNISTTVVCEKGNHLNHMLPDGSLIKLNASSTISYHPYWWYFNREVLLDGEAFFSVEKGQKFSVVSGDRITEVLGTSFNIYAREKIYNVFCKTGKVKVSNSNIELTVVPGELAKVDAQNGKIEMVEEKEILSWQQNKFIYNAKPLMEVFKEIERQYNTSIQVKLNSQSQYIFTGYFLKETPLDSTIQIICNRFNLQNIKNEDDQYIISPKSIEI